MCMIGDTRCPLDSIVNTTSLARDTCAGPHMARTTAVSSPRKAGSVTDATATPWRASGVTRVLMAHGDQISQIGGTIMFQTNGQKETGMVGIKHIQTHGVQVS